MATYQEYSEPKRAILYYGNFSMPVEVLGEYAKTYRIRTIVQGEGGLYPYVGTIIIPYKRNIKIVN
jgi:hypothetical protein